MIIKRIAALILCICVVLPFAAVLSSAQSAQFILIDGGTAEQEGNRVFGGFSAVLSEGNASLLRDYKKHSPDEYNEILHILFDKSSGVCLTGIDIDVGTGEGSASGSDMPIMLYANDTPDIRSSFSWEFAADALLVNPELKICMRCSSDPAFVTSAFEISTEAGYNARFLWFRTHIDEAYKNYGIRLKAVYPDCTSSGMPDTEWILAFSEMLRKAENTPYNYNRIKTAVSDESSDLVIAEEMLADPALMNAVSIISCADIPDNAVEIKGLAKKYGKEFIFSGGHSASDPLAFAEKIIKTYSRGKMTSYQLLPAVLACPVSAKYYPDGLITASSPWSGYYSTTATFAAAEHFTRFCEGDSLFVETAAATCDCIVFKNRKTEDITIITANNSSEPKELIFSAARVKSYKKPLKVFVSDFKAKEYLAKKADIKPETSDSSSLYRYTSPPYTVTTLTTSDCSAEYDTYCGKGESRLPLPYYDSFDGDGDIPDYFTPYCGVFRQENGRLAQKMTEGSAKSDRMFPCASFGDGTWADLSFSADVFPEGSPNSFMGISVRYSASFGKNLLSGYTLKITADGRWELLKDSDVCADGKSAPGEHKLELSAENRTVTAYIDGEEVCSFEDGESFIRSGQCAVISSYHRNSFDNIRVSPLGNSPYVTRGCADSTKFEYSDDILLSSSSYTYYSRAALVSEDAGGFLIIGDERKQHNGCYFSGVSLSEGVYSARVIFNAEELLINGYFPESTKVSLDGNEINPSVTENEVTLSGLDKNGVHSLYISSDREFAVNYVTNKLSHSGAGKISYSYTGGGFSLIGENPESALIDIVLDGKTLEKDFLTPVCGSRKCFYSYRTDDFSEHCIEITAKAGTFSLNAIETDTDSLIISEGSGKTNDFPKLSSDYSANFENVPEEDDPEISADDEPGIPADADAPDRTLPSDAVKMTVAAVTVLVSAAAVTLIYIKFSRSPKM